MNMILTPGPSVESLTERDIITATGSNAFEAGRRYAANGRVESVTIAESGGIVEGRTRGSALRPYRQRITIGRSDRGRLSISGSCSCPVGHNCKHVAAVLLKADRGRIGVTPASAPQPAAVRAPALSAGLAGWLANLERAAQAEGEDYPPEMADRLIYLLDEDQRNPGRLVVRLSHAALYPTGRLRQVREIPPWRALNDRPPYLRPSDRVILHRMLSDGGIGTDSDPGDTLSRILATGRARWHALDGTVMADAAPRPCTIGWNMRQDGMQEVVLDAGPGARVLRAPLPCYVDTASGAMGVLETGLPAQVVRLLLASPPVSKTEARLLADELQRRLPGLAIPVPTEPPAPEHLGGPAAPVLHLLTIPPDVPSWGRTGNEPAVPAARLSFRYGPLLVTGSRTASVIPHDGRMFRLRRDRRGEKRASDHLTASGLARAIYYRNWDQAQVANFVHPGAPHEQTTFWATFLTLAVPELRALGWNVEIDPSFPIRVVSLDGNVSADLAEGSGIDWFELSLGATIEGEQVDLAPALAKFIASPDAATLIQATESADDATLIPLPLLDGRYLTVPRGRIRPLLMALLELHAGGGLAPEDGRIGFSRLEAAGLALLEAAAPEIVWRGGEAVRALGRRLREAGDTIPAAALPESFAGALRGYQTHGVNWLQFLREVELGGVLADDMGLGKTVQTLAHLAIEKTAGRLDRPALIVCPTSLVTNWSAEAARFTPELRVLVLHGAGRQQFFDRIAVHDLVITTYPLLTRDAAVLTAQDWHVVVLDEAQMIKNPDATTTKLAAGLAARQRLCLSGTPLQNHLGELWSLFDFLAPGFLGSRKAFRARYQLPVEKQGDTARRDTLARRVRPFLLRRTKEQVAADLPAKTEIVEHVEMGAGQRAVYDAVRMAMHVKVREAIAARGLSRSGIVVLDALLKMRQACCDPRLLKLSVARSGKAGSAKLERLMEMLVALREDGRRILLFSQFTSMLDLIKPRLEAAALDFVELRGDTKDRATPVARFQASEVGLFLISLKAGGTGLNLTAADTVIHYDPWWNPAVEDQATDRAHRIGQERPVFVHRLVTRGSIEEKMEELKRRKRALVDGILNAERAGPMGLTEADIEALFDAG